MTDEAQTRANGFGRLAEGYDRRSIVERRMGERLLSMVDIRKTDDVLDVGCATGYFTRRLAKRTTGRVVGCDPAVAMIDRAKEKTDPESPVEFVCQAAEALDHRNAFDRIFCNATLPWFEQPELAMYQCRQALKPSGRMALQTMTGSSPVFAAAIRALRQDAKARRVFDRLASPRFFLPNLEHYRHWVGELGFIVRNEAAEDFELTVTVDEAVGIFSASELSLCPSEGRRDGDLPTADGSWLETLIADVLARQANDNGDLRLTFSSVWLILSKH